MKIAGLVIGILGTLLGFFGLVVCLALPEMTSGRVSWEEAMPGIILAGLVLFVSFIIAVIFLILVIMGRKKK